MRLAAASDGRRIYGVLRPGAVNTVAVRILTRS